MVKEWTKDELEEMETLARSGKIDEALDATFALFDGLLERGEFRLADTFLYFWDSGMDPDVTVGALMATLAARDHLQYRGELLARLEERLTQADGQEDAERTLRHLR